MTIDYSKVLESVLDARIEEKVAVLQNTLPAEWINAYEIQTSNTTNLLEFTINRFTYIFDFQAGLEPKTEVEDRVVVAYGIAEQIDEARDTNRMKGFLGPSTKVFGEGFDKGHFIAHSIGGGLDVNLFPQSKAINRGWSEPGKTYRKMERYCAIFPGTFCFSRPLYTDNSWFPYKLEFGLLKEEGNLWVESFLNI